VRSSIDAACDQPSIGDRIGEQLARAVLRGTPASDAYVRANTVAVVIRPVLRSSLDQGETITQFLPKALERWRRIAPR
jgi:hypothetical protein